MRLHMPSHRGRVDRVAGKLFDRQLAAVGSAQQPEHDLLLALLAVPVVAEGGQRAEPPHQVGGAHVVQDQGGVLQVAVDKAGLDPALAISAASRARRASRCRRQALRRAGPRSWSRQVSGGEPPGRGELGVGGEHARYHGCKGEVAGAAATAVQDALVARGSGRCRGRRRRVRGLIERSTRRRSEGSRTARHALEDGAEAVDDLGGESGEVRRRVFLRMRLAIAPTPGGAGWRVCWLGWGWIRCGRTRASRSGNTKGAVAGGSSNCDNALIQCIGCHYYGNNVPVTGALAREEAHESQEVTGQSAYVKFTFRFAAKVTWASWSSESRSRWVRPTRRCRPCLAIVHLAGNCPQRR